MMRIPRGAVVALGLTAALACDDGALAPAAAASGRCGDAAVRLQVGQSVEPATPGQTRCTVAPIPGAEYVVAWMDIRAIEGARLGPEPEFEPYPVRIAIAAPGASLTSASASDGAGAGAIAGGVDREAMADAAHAAARRRPLEAGAGEGVLETRPRFRSTPWSLGETFQLEDDATGLPRTARIVRLYDGYAAVARFEDATDDDAGLLVQLDTAYALLAAMMTNLSRAVWGDAPLRSSSAGQYLIVLQRQTTAQVRTLEEVAGDTLYAWMLLFPGRSSSALRLAGLMVHEMTHSYQGRYMHATRAAPNLPTYTGASFWGVEGGANLMSYEFMRRMAGIGFNVNHDWRAPPTSDAAAQYQLRAQPASGTLTAGFDNAMGFLRDLVLRRMASAETQEQAMTAVSRGAIEGWFGLDGSSQRSGLTARMQSRLGPGWEPVDAVLDWALSHAADDLTPNPRYQDGASLRIWDLPGLSYGWHPDAELTPASPAFFLFKRYGSPGWFRVRGVDAGATVEVEAFEVPARWRLLRIR